MKTFKNWKNKNLLIRDEENNIVKMRFLDFKYDYPQAARDAGFKLKQYKDGPIDWRLIGTFNNTFNCNKIPFINQLITLGSLEVHHLTEEQNFEQIDGALDHLAEVPLGCLLDTNVLESGIVKYFMLAQYSIQYLLFCRSFLEDSIGDLKESNDSAQKEIAALKQTLTDANHQILRLHRKVTEIEALHEVVYPCHLCTKNFISNDALSLHLCRKHPGSLNRRTTVLSSNLPLVPADDLFCNSQDCDQALINTIKLELELKHLKERLSQTEREVKERNVNVMVPTLTSAPEVIRTFQHIAIQSNLTESKEIDESNKDEDESVPAKDATFVVMENDKCDENAEDDKCQEEKLPSPAAEDNVLSQQLEEQLNNFEEWKKDQQKQNEGFMMTIQEKIQHLTLAVEHQINKKLAIEESVNTAAESTLPDFEKLLNTKMENMTSVNISRLENIVMKMNTDYNNRLERLQKDLSNYMKTSELLKSPQNVSNDEINKEIASNNQQIDNKGNDDKEGATENAEYSIKERNENLNKMAQIMVASTAIKPIPKQVTEVQVKEVKQIKKDRNKMKNNLEGSSSEEKDTSYSGTYNVSEVSSLEDVQGVNEDVDVNMNKMSEPFIKSKVQEKITANYAHREEKPRKIR